MDSGSRSVIREFYDGHAQALFTYALALTGCPATAEDVLHDVVCKLLARRELPDALRPYVFRCVRNAAVDARRRARPSEPVAVLDLEESRGRGFDSVLLREIEGHLQRLPDDEMETIVLHLLNGLTFREIAEVKQAPQNTVTSWYRRGLERLRDRIGESR